jgi:hypothetical protein
MSFVMSVCPFVRVEQLESHWTDFYKKKLMFRFFFQNMSRKIKVSLKSEKKTGTSREDVFAFMTICHWILLRIRNVLDKTVEKIKTHILLSKLFFFQKSHPLWGNVKKNVMKEEVINDVTIWRIIVACWISKATHTHSRKRIHKPTLPSTHTHSTARTHTQTNT